MTFVSFALWVFWLLSTLGCFALGFQLGKLIRGSGHK